MFINFIWNCHSERKLIYKQSTMMGNVVLPNVSKHYFTFQQNNVPFYENSIFAHFTAIKNRMLLSHFPTKLLFNNNKCSKRVYLPSVRVRCKSKLLWRFQRRLPALILLTKFAAIKRWLLFQLIAVVHVKCLRVNFILFDLIWFLI